MTPGQWSDWDLAARIGVELVPSGPVPSPAQLTELVDDLRASAAAAPELVAQAAQLDNIGDADELVVDRPGFVRANVQTVQVMLADAVTRHPGLGARIAGTGTAAAIGGTLALLGSRVLGQFDPFQPRPRLLLVAPTIWQVAEDLGVEHPDFRMWVCLHEQTHRLQFANAPWLVEHLRSLISEMIHLDTVSGGELLRTLPERVARLRSGRSEKLDSISVMLAMAPPRMTEVMDEAVAVMSVLEGHAEVIMDLAAPSVVPTLATIRHRFELQRGRGGVAGLLGRLIGLEAKLTQYRDGARFCRYISDRVGLEGFNTVFATAQHLPSIEELHEPERWLARMAV